MPFFKRKSHDKDGEKALTLILDNLRILINHLPSTLPYVYNRLGELASSGQLDAFEAPYAVKAAIVNTNQHSFEDALDLAVWSYKHMKNDTVRQMVADAFFTLAARTDKTNTRQMAAVAEGAGLIAIDTAHDNPGYEQARTQWQEAAGTLRQSKEGLSRIFEIASGFAAAPPGKSSLNADGLACWITAVNETSKMDRAAAFAEASRVEHTWSEDKGRYASILHHAAQRMMKHYAP